MLTKDRSLKSSANSFMKYISGVDRKFLGRGERLRFSTFEHSSVQICSVQFFKYYYNYITTNYIQCSNIT